MMNGYTAGTDATYELMKGDPEKDWVTGHDYGFDKGWIAATEGHTAAKEASYDEGFDTAMTNFEADERIVKMTDEAYGNGYTCGIHNGITELYNEIIKQVDKGGMDYASITTAMINVKNDHPLMKEKK